ncbi:transposase [Chitinophagaceae bacterium LB-8]|uniref:Transposase n=1 Tax=Paraflavisolibacter caeni TaxID=2982496 RepID=A0A9X2Y280_9BACT|nr:DDE-type integrase/transposase/recombinase [Paraflavisolibacter caeni]MCU7552288.1 transposase [Paraflavisolibacter caeni]
MYRAVNKAGNPIDFLFTKRRNKFAGHEFLMKVISEVTNRREVYSEKTWFYLRFLIKSLIIRKKERFHFSVEPSFVTPSGYKLFLGTLIQRRFQKNFYD